MNYLRKFSDYELETKREDLKLKIDKLRGEMSAIGDEFELRRNYNISDTLHTISEIDKNYNMGLITQQS